MRAGIRKTTAETRKADTPAGQADHQFVIAGLGCGQFAGPYDP